jgi:TonB family protein
LYRRQTGVLEEFYVPKDEKVYLRFKGIDTLYYRDYADDTTLMQSVIKNTGSKKIAGYDCPSITLTTQSDTSLYYFAPPLYANPAHSQKLLIGHLNLLSEQTKAIWLEGETRTGNYVQSSTCMQVLPGKLDEKAFALPQLPVAKFNYTSIFTAPRYAGRGSWAAYIQQNMNLKLVAGSLPLKKKEKAAQQTARVSFVVSENGEVTDVMVTNMKDVHPALAEEAIRLVQKARWSPAVLLNEKLSLTLVQPIVFRVEAE